MKIPGRKKTRQKLSGMLVLWLVLSSFIPELFLGLTGPYLADAREGSETVVSGLGLTAENSVQVEGGADIIIDPLSLEPETQETLSVSEDTITVTDIPAASTEPPVLNEAINAEPAENYQTDFYENKKLDDELNSEQYYDRLYEEQRFYEEKTRKLLKDAQSGETQDISTEPRMLQMESSSGNSFDTVGIKSAAGGDDHTLVVKEDGSVWSWGDNYMGELGNYSDQPHEYRTTPSRVYGWYDGYYNTSPVKMVSAGRHASMALKSDGTVWAWGDNYFNLLGIDESEYDYSSIVTFARRVRGLYGITEIAAGNEYQIALDYYGSVYTWGSNWDGELGTGAEWHEESCYPTEVSGLQNIIAVSAGYRHALALQSDGSVWAWGSNTYGEIGDGTSGLSNDRFSPVQVIGLPKIIAIAAGECHSLALAENGQVYAWGSNGSGQLGNGDKNNSSTPVLIQGLDNVKTIAAGGFFSMAVKNDGTVWCWGDNGSGQLGNGGITDCRIPVVASGLSNISSISAGRSYAMAIREDGTLWMWGADYCGQLGNGDSKNRPQSGEVNGQSQVESISGNPCSFVTTKLDDSVWHWGDCDSNPYQLEVPAGVKSIIDDYSFTVILKDDGSVWTKGDNSSGQLGVETSISKSDVFLQVAIQDVKKIVADTDSVLALKNDGTLWSWGGSYAKHDGVYGYAPTQVTSIDGVADIADLSQVIKYDGTVWHLYDVPEQEEGLSDVKAFDGELCLKNDGSVWTSGDNRYGELGIGSGTPSYSQEWVQVPGLNDIKAIVAGSYHNMALGSDGKVWTWGYNGDGQIGNGEASMWDYCYSPVQVEGLPEISAIAASQYSSAALSSNGQVYTWGGNCFGELGDGAILYRSVPAMSQIYTLPPVPSFSFSPITLDTNTIVSFDASASTAPESSIIAYSWDFGDGTTDTGINPRHLYDNAGAFTITLTVTNEKGKTASCSQTVNVTYVPPIPPQSIKLNRNTLSLQAGMGKATLTTILTPENADRHITWTSNNESFARVENGVVTPISEGTAIITATTTNNLSDTCTVTVTPPPIDLPYIKNVQMYIDVNRLDNGAVFLDGVDLQVKFNPDIDWRGKSPGSIEVITPGGKFTANQEFSFNVGRDFGPGGEMQVYAVDIDGKRSPVYYGKFIVASNPLEGLVQWRYGKEGCSGNANINYTSTANFALGIIEQNIQGDTFPNDIPFFGKNEVNIKLYPNFTAEFDLKGNKGSLVLVNCDESGSSEEESKLNLAGMILNTAKRDINLTMQAGLEFHYDADKHRWSYGGSVTSGIEGYAQTPTVTWYIPVPAFPSPVPVNGRMGLGIKYEASETLKDIIPVAASISSLAPYLAGESKLNPYGKVIGGVGIADKIEGQLIGKLGLEGCWASGNQPLCGFLPSELNIKGSIGAALILYKFTLETPVYEYNHQIYGAQEFQAEPGFTLLSRDYLKYGEPSFVKGGIHTVQSLEDTGEEPIKLNTYPYSEPTIVSSDNTRYLFWIDENLQRDPGLNGSPNSSELVFAIDKDNIRSNPLPVADDGTADFGVQAGLLPDGRILAVWENVSTKLPVDAGVNDMLGAMDIAYGIYSPDTGQWQNGSVISDTSLDCSPKLSIGTDGTAMICWTKNNSNKIWGDNQNPDGFMYSIWDGNTWSLPAAISTDFGSCIVHSSMWYNGQEACLVWESDTDNDLSTLNDRELVSVNYIKDQGWQTACRLTDNSVADSHPELVFDGQQILLFWLQDYNLMMSKGITPLSAELIVDNTKTSGDTSYKVISNPTQLDLLWAGPSPEGSDIYLTHWDSTNSLWGEPQQITHDVNLERNIAGCYTDADQFTLIYDKQEISDNEEGIPVAGRTDLCLLTHRESTDLKVENIILDNQNLLAGQDVNITANIVNTGETIPAGYAVSFFNGDPDNGGELIANVPASELIVTGGSQAITCTWTLPSSANATIFARVDLLPGWTDANTSNNILSKNITIAVPGEQTDLALAYLVPSNSFPKPGENLAIYTEVTNLGDTTITSPVTVKLYLGNPVMGGELISTQSTSSSLASSQASALTFNWTPSGNGRQYLYATIELPASAADDTQTSNNQLSTVVDVSSEPDYNPPAYIESTTGGGNTIIAVIFDKALYNNLSTDTALKQAVEFTPDGINYSNLSENDTVTINGSSLVVIFDSPLTGDTNKLRIAGNALKSVNGNVLESTVETENIKADECFIATAAFGSKFTWPVALLRHFRDQYLLTNIWGTAFVRFYYHHSPPIAASIAHSQSLRLLVRLLLAPVIAMVYMMYHPILTITILVLLIVFLVYGFRLRRRYVQA
ncbi:MAG: CFI-box-CTERM domain-containing protein [Syntrophomonas sp.]